MLNLYKLDVLLKAQTFRYLRAKPINIGRAMLMHPRTGVVNRHRVPSLNHKNMVKAISGALSLALIILVLRWALPEIADLLVQIIVQCLSLVKGILDQISIPQIN